MILAVSLTIVVIYSISILYLTCYITKNKVKPANVGKNPTITMVVACKNESRNLPNLFESIDNQTVLPDRIVFVDDHSTDSTHEQFTQYAEGKAHVKVLKATGKGKKAAILQAVSTVDTDYIFFTDADCTLPHDYFLKTLYFLAHDSDTDMLLGGVEIIAADNLFNRLERMEFAALQAVTAASAIMGRPIMCNGANLTVKTSEYRSHTSQIRRDIASGDDMFMLHAFKSGGKIIKYLSGNIVATKGTGNLSRFGRQRTRWAGKTPFYTDRLTIFIAVLVALTNIIMLVAPWFNPLHGLMLFAIKSAADFAILYRYLTQNKTANQGCNLLRLFPLAAVIYPFYCVITGCVSIFTNRHCTSA